MEFTILKEEKDTLEIEFYGEGHTFCNLLRNELWQSSDTLAASYQMQHPFTSKTIFTLKTKSAKPRKTIQEAVTSLKKKIKELKVQAQKL